MARPTKGEERRAEILAAFEACVLAKGFERTTLTDVAETAGQPRSLVRHFIGNRDQMVATLIDRLLARAEQQIDGLPKLDSVDQLMSLLMERVFDDPTTNIVIMELWHVALRDERVRDRLADVYGGLIAKVAEMVADAGGDPTAPARAFAAVSMAFGAGFYRYLGLHPPCPDHLAANVRATLVGDSPSSRARN